MNEDKNVDPRVEEYKAKLDALDARSEALEAEAKAEYLEQKNDLNETIESWSEASEDKWEEMKTKADATWTTLKEKFKSEE